ncbi:Hypothetical protein CAP_0506 [Chondromyces apiculatus DSM 436]|uniref:DUF2169 domain-containing protein n=1 Tax=Chondromyces apiculatus DSM 436 TaxID=1192034 RepID=A0A017SU96_9BACT|nr:Hypothetical protein CAP_0506 [Chondromyces apiculatus DSM 436]
MDVTPVGPVAATSVVWRMGGQLAVTVIVKATFAMVPDAAMELADPDPIVTAEIHHAGSPARSIRAASDLAPFLPRADVMLIGHAHAPEGRAVTRQVVRLAVYREKTLLGKTLYVYGDRMGGEPVPFQAMPLVYERAFGGIGWSDNPLGTGSAAEGLAARAPNIEVPRRPGVTGGFGPVSRGWPARRKLAGGIDRRALDAPLIELPTTFDWTYFQAAPPDQRVEHLAGDEWVELEGMHPDLPNVQSCLPGAHAEARVTVAGQPWGGNVVFRADTLRIDADTGRCALVWRAVLPLRTEEELAALRVVVGVAMRDRPVAWPGEPARAASPLPEGRRAREGTVVMSLAGDLAAAGQIFEGGGTEDLPAPRPDPTVHLPPVIGLDTPDTTVDVMPGRAPVAPIPFRPAAPSAGPVPTSAGASQGAALLPGAPWSGVPVVQHAPTGSAPLELDGSEQTVTYTPHEIAALPPAPPVWGRPAAPRRAPGQAAWMPEASAGPAPAPPPPAAPPAARTMAGGLAPAAPLGSPVPAAPPPATAGRTRGAGLVPAHTTASTPPPLPPPPPPPPPPLATAPAQPPPPPVHPGRTMAGGLTPSPPLAPLAPVAPPPGAAGRTASAGLAPGATASAGLAPGATASAGLAPGATASAGLTPSATASAGLAPGVDEAPAPAETLREQVQTRLREGLSLDWLDLAGADLSGVDFSGSALAGMDLSKANLAGCRFVGARLAGAQLAGANLKGAILDEADLTRADLTGAQMHEVRARKAVLDEAVLEGVRAEGAHLVECSLRHARAAGSSWDKATLDGSSFEGVALAQASFARATAVGANFSGAVLVDARLGRARLHGSSFVRANLMRANLEGADLTDADLTDANLHAAETWKARMPRPRSG